MANPFPFNVGAVLTAAQMNSIGESLSFTPVWTCSGTAPAIGNGSLTGTYWRVQNLIYFRIILTAGSTTTFGTGNFRFNLPIAVDSSLKNMDFYVQSIDSGTAWFTNGYGEGASQGSSTFFTLFTSAGVAYSAAVPFTWTTNDSVIVVGAYLL